MKQKIWKLIVSVFFALSSIFPMSMMSVFAVDDTSEQTVIPHTKTDGDSNYFTFSSRGWSAMGSSNEHVWSDNPSANLPADQIWYEVKFIGNKIDVYAGKNRPMGMVAYYIDNELKGEYSLYNSSNINSTKIATFEGLEEGEHTFKAVATGKRAEGTGTGNTLIDCAQLVVYHAPYAVTEFTLEQERFDLMEGATQAIHYTIAPDYATVTDLVFTSNNQEIASVSKEGLISANKAGETTIEVTSEKQNIHKTVTVNVTKAIPGLGGSIVDTDSQYTQDRYEEVENKGVLSAEVSAWRNDKAISEIAVISKNSKLTNVTVTVNDLVSGENTIAKEHVKATFIKSTKAYVGPFLGYGHKDENDSRYPAPPETPTNRKESSDILYQSEPIDVEYNKVQPIWVEFAIPEDAKAGSYTTTIEVSADGIEEPLCFTYTVDVQDVRLNDPETYKDTFDIELWQYPYALAEYYDVEPFSDRHFELLRSNMEIYKSIGGHAITTTVSEDAWSGQTYSANAIHYPSMVKWTKNSDGTFSYDYTNFDKWVQFNKDLGMGDKIILYSIAPWHNSFTYWEGNTLIKEPFTAGTDRYNEVWGDFLHDMIDHLMEKGWFDDAYVGIDERGFSKAAFDLIDSVRNIHDKPLKTAGAMDHFTTKYDLALRVTDLNVGDNAAAANAATFTKLLADREALGYRTTLYSCTEHVPGNFALSAPVESYWSIINAGKETAGFLRWAYDAWVQDPLRDTTHYSFEPGDCFLIYPDEKDAKNPVSKSSVRLEQMAAGVRDVNKIKMMVAEIPSLQADVDAMYAKITQKAGSVPGGRYLTDAQKENLAKEMNQFKADLKALTEKYIYLKANGTTEVSEVTIDGGNQNLALGSSKQLHATVSPDNVLNNSVTWSTSDESVISVTKTGVIYAAKLGNAEITATSVQDPKKSATITVNVTVPQVEEEARVAYYSFDDHTANDAWGERNGIDNGVEFVPGKSGNAIRATETKNITFDRDSELTENSAWTISYWVKAEKPLTDRFSVLMDKNKDFSFDLKMASNRDAGFHVGKKDGDVLTFAYPFAENTWYNIAWTQSKQAGLSMYVNGKFVQQNNWTKTNRTLAPFDMIGGTGFEGLIDEVKVYNRILTASEINSDMLIKGLNIPEHEKTIFVDSTYEIKTNLISDEEDKTITYTSNHPEIASVNDQGIVTGHKRGEAMITVRNDAAGYEDVVRITVTKDLIIKNTLDTYKLPENRLSDIEKAPGTDRQYLGQPDMIQTNTGRLITAYPKGHGKGPIIMKYSDNLGETWTEKLDTPSTWTGSQETPTLFTLDLGNGKERIMMITACPGWGSDSDGNQYGWNTSYSDDNGETWTQYKHWYSTRKHDGANNDVIVGMASLVQLKDEEGNFIQKWMGVYHTYNYVNYKTYLTFDENGNEVWSEPEPYLSDYRNIESTYKMCEIGMFRSPDGNRIVGLARSQSHNNPATLIYSDDEGETWSKPMDLPGSLAGERHKATYDPISGRLVITFREIKYDLNGNNKFDGNSDWTCGEWVAWVGTYEDLMEQNEGQYMIQLEEDWANNAKSGDTGYAGVVVLDDGTFIMDSYGHWDKDFSLSWTGGVTTDLCYIKQAKFKLSEMDNIAGLISRDLMNQAIESFENLDKTLYTKDSYEAARNVYLEAVSVNENVESTQAELDAKAEELNRAINNLARIYTVTVNGEAKATGTYNTKVSVSAPAVEGKQFTGWLWNDTVISTDETYTFFISEDMELTPCYEEVEVTAQALLTNALLTKRTDGKADAKFVAQLIVPVGYTIKNAGLVWSSKEDTVLDLEHAKPTYITRISNTNQFSVTIKGMPKGRFIRGRIFATLVDAEGNETIVYSVEETLNN